MLQIAPLQRSTSYTLPTILGTILVLITCGIVLLTHRHDRDVAAVQHSYEVENHLVALLTTLQDAETGQRGFLLTGRPEYLAPYSAARTAFVGELSALNEMTAGDAAQQQTLAQLRDTADGKLQELQSTIALYQGGDAPASLALVKTDKGQVLMDDLRQQISDMRRREDASRQARARAATLDTDLIFAAVGLAGLFTIVFTAISVANSKAAASLLQAAYARAVSVNEGLEQSVSERTRELEEANTHLNLILENAVDYAIVTTDLEGTVTSWSTGATAMMGWTAAEMLGGKLHQIFTPENRRSGLAERQFGKALADGRAGEDDWFVRKDGSIFWASGELVTLRAEGGSLMGFLKIMRDRTAERNTEERLRTLNASLEDHVAARTDELATANRQLIAEMQTREKAEGQIRQMQKMDAIGQLTGGIAHDFNNMLAIVIGSLNLIERRLTKGDTDIGRYVEAAIDGATRAATLTSRLLAFSRQQPLAPEPVQANRLVTGMSELLRRTLGETIRIETVLAGGLWNVHADSGQLENAILNLAVNARDAMSDGGKLTIETANTHLDEAYADQNQSGEPGQYVMIAISDTGSGMPAEVIAKAFDPFFTTKAIGKGTGLGLSQVYGFVKQSGGHVKIYSEAGQGTSVKIYLPRFMGVATAVPERTVEPASLMMGSAEEIVLVVEDDQRVRQFAVEALRELGYTVVHAENAMQALGILDSTPGIGLMLTDIVMPEINGRKLADLAHARRPDLAVVYMTGFTRNAVVHNGVLDADVSLLAKPFTIGQLSAKIRDALTAAARQKGEPVSA